jgi:hypothetical protein
VWPAVHTLILIPAKPVPKRGLDGAAYRNALRDIEALAPRLATNSRPARGLQIPTTTNFGVVGFTAAMRGNIRKMNLKNWTQHDDPRDDALADAYVAAYEKALPPASGNMHAEKARHWQLAGHAAGVAAVVKALAAQTAATPNS